jgi:acetyltransferase-like isoleucine patch superfamily enzyme
LAFGSYNLVASNVIFRGRNDHAMYDLKTKKVLNNEERLVIGDNNWICDNVQLMPKANIKNGNVIALGSIVNKKLKCSNSLIAGIPAVVKKEGIGWNISANLDDIKRGH